MGAKTHLKRSNLPYNFLHICAAVNWLCMLATATRFASTPASASSGTLLPSSIQHHFVASATSTDVRQHNRRRSPATSARRRRSPALIRSPPAAKPNTGGKKPMQLFDLSGDLQTGATSNVPAAQKQWMDSMARAAALDPASPNYKRELQDVFWQLKRNSPPPLTNREVAIPGSASPVTSIAARNQWQFTVDDQPFYFAGTNIYGIACQAELWSEDAIRNTLNVHAARGANVIRIWGFADGFGEYEQWQRPFPFQPTPGVFNETNLQRLDLVLSYGSSIGLRFTVALSNNWPDFGGRQWYVNQLLGNGTDIDMFYVSEATRDAYKAWVRYLLTRVNTYTGLTYSEDPAIFSWNLMNEPTTAPGFDESLGWTPGTAIANWVAEMAAFVKSLDPNHLLSVGDEGYRTDLRNTVPLGWTGDGYKGVGADLLIADPNIDYQTIHFYGESFSVETWNYTGWFNWYAANRAFLARQYNKPTVLEEIGVLLQSQPSREVFLESVFNASLYAGFGGVLVWQVAPSGAPLPSDLDFGYDQEGGQAMQAAYDWAALANSGGPAYVTFGEGPPCLNYPVSGKNQTCTQLAPTPSECWDFMAGFCLDWCNICPYFNILRKFSPYWTDPLPSSAAEAAIADEGRSRYSFNVNAPRSDQAAAAGSRTEAELWIGDVVTDTCTDVAPRRLAVPSVCNDIALAGHCHLRFIMKHGYCRQSCNRCP